MNKLNKKIFGTLFFSIFAAVTGVGIVVPLLPVYAHDLGATGIYIGLIFGAFSLSRTFFLPYFGRLSDKKGRKPFIVAGLLTYALISFLFLFADNVAALIAVRFFHGISSAMMMPVILAYVGDITPNGREGLTMGMFNMAMFLGLSLGPLVGGVIKDDFGLNVSFICMGFLALTGFLLTLFLLPPKKSEHIICSQNSLIPWKQLLKDRNVAGLYIFRFSYATCIGIIWGFLPVLADSELSLSSSSIGILVMIGVFVSGALHVPMGYLADRVNKKAMVVTGGVISGLGIFAFDWVKSFNDLFIANVFFGIGGGISISALMALAVIQGNKSKAMGSIMGLLTMAHSMGMLLGALCAGMIMDAFQLRLAFPFGTVIMISGALIFFICTHQKSEVKGRRSEVGDQKAEIRRQKSKGIGDL
ncbi:MAG: MFS transporter [Thermodesulfobacteriota bacterium]|nr:MFS transporter [Thermodesulfobacteriota bacterium]